MSPPAKSPGVVYPSTFAPARIVLSSPVIPSLRSCFIKVLKTNIREEWVCSTETSITALTPVHFSPQCVAEWRVSGFNGQANGFELLKCRRGPPVPVCLFVAFPPSTGADPRYLNIKRWRKEMIADIKTTKCKFPYYWDPGPWKL